MLWLLLDSVCTAPRVGWKRSCVRHSWESWPKVTKEKCCSYHIMFSSKIGVGVGSLPGFSVVQRLARQQLAGGEWLLFASFAFLLLLSSLLLIKLSSSQPKSFSHLCPPDFLPSSCWVGGSGRAAVLCFTCLPWLTHKRAHGQVRKIAWILEVRNYPI